MSWPGGEELTRQIRRIVLLGLMLAVAVGYLVLDGMLLYRHGHADMFRGRTLESPRAFEFILVHDTNPPEVVDRYAANDATLNRLYTLREQKGPHGAGTKIIVMARVHWDSWAPTRSGGAHVWAKDFFTGHDLKVPTGWEDDARALVLATFGKPELARFDRFLAPAKDVWIGFVRNGLAIVSAVCVPLLLVAICIGFIRAWNVSDTR